MKNSPAMALIQLLAPWPVQVYDPVVRASTAPHTAVKEAGTALEAATGTDALAIMTPWPEFRSLEPSAPRVKPGCIPANERPSQS